MTESSPNSFAMQSRHCCSAQKTVSDPLLPFCLSPTPSFTPVPFPVLYKSTAPPLQFLSIYPRELKTGLHTKTYTKMSDIHNGQQVETTAGSVHG